MNVLLSQHPVPIIKSIKTQVSRTPCFQSINVLLASLDETMVTVETCLKVDVV